MEPEEIKQMARQALMRRFKQKFPELELAFKDDDRLWAMIDWVASLAGAPPDDCLLVEEEAGELTVRFGPFGDPL